MAGSNLKRYCMKVYFKLLYSEDVNKNRRGNSFQHYINIFNEERAYCDQRLDYAL